MLRRLLLSGGALALSVLLLCAAAALIAVGTIAALREIWRTR